MIKSIAGKKVDHQDLFIKWNTSLKISKEAKMITRYDQKKVDRLAQSFNDVFPIISDWLDSCDYIVGHNILGFDIYLIKEMYLLKGRRIDHLVEKIIDTNCIAKGVKYPIPKMNNESLIDYQYKLLHTRKKGVKTNQLALGKDYKIEHDYDRLHDAIVDLELNLKIWNTLKFQADI
jgi:DNA polymerase III epsilon subunit-like protein